MTLTPGAVDLGCRGMQTATDRRGPVVLLLSSWIIGVLVPLEQRAGSSTVTVITVMDVQYRVSLGRALWYPDDKYKVEENEIPSCWLYDVQFSYNIYLQIYNDVRNQRE